VFWELNLSWLTPQLAVGGRFPMEAAPFLGGELGVRHVVDLRLEDRDEEQVLRREGIALLHLPTPDMSPPTQRMLWQGVEWVAPLIRDGHKVYVHCEFGIGRSALLCLCLLVHTGMDPVDALAMAKQKRPVVSPSPEQLNAYLAFLTEWKRRYRAPWEVPTFDALAEIAYSHLRQVAKGEA